MDVDSLKKTRIFIDPIKFEDAPEMQNPIIHTDYKVRCKVSANPPPHVDWSKNNEPIKSSNKYIIEPDGLLISKVTESDDGVYTCRAIVIKTGELATRHIKVEVIRIHEMKGVIDFTGCLI